MTPFAQVQASLAGARIPLDDGSMKLLYFMLERREGCDVTVTPDVFFIQYGWHLAHHRYSHDSAPRMVSWLCEAAPAGYLAAGTLPWWFENTGQVQREIFVDRGRGADMLVRRERLKRHWTHGPRRIWFDTSPERVVIMVRDATVDPGAEAFPAPIEPPPVYLTGQHPCPHCGVVPERYRKLRDGALVCLACGSSSG